MKEHWIADRSRLRELLRTHPDWSKPELARQLERSLGWVKQWCARLRAAPPGGTRRRRSTRWSSSASSRSATTRRRTSSASPAPSPSSITCTRTRSSWPAVSGSRARRAPSGRCSPGRPHRPPPAARPRAPRPPAPAVAVAARLQGRLDRPGRARRQAPACGGGAQLRRLRHRARARQRRPERLHRGEGGGRRGHGPAHLRPPRHHHRRSDPRFVGSSSGRDFPAPFVRFLTCLGVEVEVCPLRRPDRNGFVERYHRTLDHECLQVRRPACWSRPGTRPAPPGSTTTRNAPTRPRTAAIARRKPPSQPSRPCRRSRRRWIRTAGSGRCMGSASRAK